MVLGVKVGLSPGDFVFDGDQASLPKKGAEPHPNFLPCLLWPNETAGWIKVALGMEVGLGPGQIVLDGAQLLSPKGTESPNFWPMSIVANRLDRLRRHLVRK